MIREGKYKVLVHTETDMYKNDGEMLRVIDEYRHIKIGKNNSQTVKNNILNITFWENIGTGSCLFMGNLGLNGGINNEKMKQRHGLKKERRAVGGVCEVFRPPMLVLATDI